MNILITGAGGLIGRKLAAALAARGELGGQIISSLTLADVVPSVAPDTALPVRTMVADIASAADVACMITPETAAIFHLAAILSGHAEADFDEGMRVNLNGTMLLLDRARTLGQVPLFVFASSIATLGGEVPDPVEDWTATNPQTSYGTQKAIGELLVNDYSRRGFIRGRSVRLPTISVRPGKPNRAASSFMSSIIREPLAGIEASCPMPREFCHYYLSPRQCVANFITLAELGQDALGQNCTMVMPGLTLTINDLLQAMTRVAGPGPARLVRFTNEPEIANIVSGWRADFRPKKALALGLKPDRSFDDNVRYYLTDDSPPHGHPVQANA